MVSKFKDSKSKFEDEEEVEINDFDSGVNFLTKLKNS